MPMRNRMPHMRLDNTWLHKHCPGPFTSADECLHTYIKTLIEKKILKQETIRHDLKKTALIWMKGLHRELYDTLTEKDRNPVWFDLFETELFEFDEDQLKEIRSYCDFRRYAQDKVQRQNYSSNKEYLQAYISALCDFFKAHDVDTSTDLIGMALTDMYEDNMGVDEAECEFVISALIHGV
eukprot:20795-Hanusia_phi.AAC.1